jgi:hypothetical protein
LHKPDYPMAGGFPLWFMWWKIQSVNEP